MLEKFTTLNKYKEEKLSIIAQNQNESLNQKNDTNHPVIKRKNRTRNGINYASNECGAKVIGSNPEAYHPNVILTSSKDSYMLNPCNSPRKWIIIELCEEIGVEEIQIGNYEYFSSIFKDFQVLGSNQYPTKYWDLIGNYTSKNERVLQSFTVKDDPIWYKYIKVRFLSHWGKEFYCPISEVRVYGLPIAEKLNAQLEQDTEYIHQLEKIIDPSSDNDKKKDEHTQTENPLREEYGHFKPKGPNAFDILINDLKQTKNKHIQSDFNEILKDSSINEDSMNFVVPKIEVINNQDNDNDDDDDEVTKKDNTQKTTTTVKKSDILSVSKVFEKVVEKIRSIETKQSLHSGYLKNITLFYYEELINLNGFFSKRYNKTSKEIKDLKQTMKLISDNSTETNKMVNRLINELNDLKILMENRHSFFMIQSIATSLILSLILCFSIVYFIARFNIIPMIKSKSLLVLNKRSDKVKLNTKNDTKIVSKPINRPNGVYIPIKKKIEKEGKKELKRSISF